MYSPVSNKPKQHVLVVANGLRLAPTFGGVMQRINPRAGYS